MASEPTDTESAVSTLNFLFNGHLVTYCINIACKLNIAGVIAEAGKALSLQELEEKIHGEVNSTYLKRFVNYVLTFLLTVFIKYSCLSYLYQNLILEQLSQKWAKIENSNFWNLRNVCE